MRVKVSVGIIGTVLTLSTSQSWAVTLEPSRNQDKSHPIHETMKFFAKRGKEYSNGDITIRVYLGRTLGTQRETMELIRFDTIPLVEANTAEMETSESSYKLFSLPYPFRDHNHYYRVMQGGVRRKALDSTKGKGYFGLTFYDGGTRSFYGNKPVLKPDDLKGMKVRVQSNSGAVEAIKVMGGNPTPPDYGGLYTALQRGVVDMAENSIMALTTMRYGEVAKSFSLDEHTMVPDVALMSNAVFDRLSSEDQAVILKTARESMSYMKDLWSEGEEQEFAKLDKMGVKVYQIDKAPFIEKVQPMCVNFAKDSPALAPMLADIQAAK